MILHGVDSSYAYFAENTYVGNIALAGVWSFLKLTGFFDSGILSNMATGYVEIDLGNASLVPFSPALQIGGTAGGIEYSVQKGAYQVQGNRVDIEFNIQLSSKGTNTGDLYLTGLPYGANAVYYGSGGGAVVYYANVTSINGTLSVDVVSGETTGNFYILGATGPTPMNDTNISDTTVMKGHLVYFM